MPEGVGEEFLARQRSRAKIEEELSRAVNQEAVAWLAVRFFAAFRKRPSTSSPTKDRRKGFRMAGRTTLRGANGVFDKQVHNKVDPDETRSQSACPSARIISISGEIFALPGKKNRRLSDFEWPLNEKRKARRSHAFHGTLERILLHVIHRHGHWESQ